LQHRSEKAIVKFSQVFVTVGGCDADDHFIDNISVLDFQHKTRSGFCSLPTNKNSTRFITDNESRSSACQDPNKLRWAEFGCVAWKNNIVITGGKDSRKVKLFKKILGVSATCVFVCACHRLVADVLAAGSLQRIYS